MKAIEAPKRTDLQNRMVEDAAEMAADQTVESEMIGYVIMTFYSDGDTRNAGWRPSTSDHKVGADLFNAWARATLDSHFVYRDGLRAARDVLNGDA